TRGASIASARVSGHLSLRQPSMLQRRLQPSPPVVQVAVARPPPPRPDSRAQVASTATERPPTPPSEAVPDQRSPQPDSTANQSAGSDPTDTATEDRRKLTAATAVPSRGVTSAPNEDRRAPSTATNQGPRSVQKAHPTNEC